MRIGLSDIDPQIAQALEDRLCAPLKEFLQEDIHWGGFFPFNWQFHAGGLQVRRKREPTEDERRAFELRKKREEQFSARIVATVFGPICGGAAIGGMLSAVSVEAGVLSGLVTFAAGLTSGVRWSHRATQKARLREEVRLEEMRAVFPLLRLTRAERVYCDTLLLLARMDATPEAEQTVRETLRQLNDLLESSRQLETRRQSLLPLLGANVVKELEEEYGALGRRLDEATDNVTRQSLQQSLQMCAARLENARALQQGLERLNVQQEAIIHTLASAQSALARMQVSPEPQAALAAEEIAETVAQMNQQTYAVEQAVQEVISLRAQ
ncbi:MAG TPA: hypothetical protein VFB38_19365 [Chthonomonadaceae bacterium]|nr:hypothetical protein [Chthonomonadaceae bacterium]